MAWSEGTAWSTIYYGAMLTNFFVVLPRLLIQWPFFKFITGFRWLHSLKPLLIINLITIPTSVVVVFLIMALSLNGMTSFGGSEIQWLETLYYVWYGIVVIAINAVLDMTFLAGIFSSAVQWSWKNLVRLALSHILCVGMMVGIFFLPLESEGMIDGMFGFSIFQGLWS